MKNYLSFALFLLLLPTASAKHIIGGVLSYECLGGGLYRFTMKMYRDCSDPTGAFFDSNAPFSIYKGDNTLLTTKFVNPTDITSVDPPDNPCLELPPNVCVQEGSYTFTHQFAEWPSADSYTISYQRCCRNNTVTNLVTPGEIGATFTVTITPASQEVCNNSPVYNAFPPTVVCVNEPIAYDHSAVDADGDQLVYEMCAPLRGGGQGGLGGGNPNGCNGVVPNPACPPPYQPVSFINPPYSALNPMGGNPAVTIDPVSGMLSGTPVTIGQFVVGICIKEYRNGVLLSEVRRDFQFNVASCESLVDADLSSAGLTVSGDDYLIETCNDPTVFIQNTSINPQNVVEIRWEFTVGDSTWMLSTWDALVNFPGAGSYPGKLLINPGSLCSDSARLLVEVYPEVTAAFTYGYDTCVAGPVSFYDGSAIADGSAIDRWLWKLDNTVFDSLRRNPVHVYDEPKTFPVRLTVWDSHGCSDDTVRNVVYKPVPSLIVVKPNDTVSCPPAAVRFNNLSAPIDETYDIRWDFGDGGTSTDISPVHVYTTEGTFDVTLEINSPIGCQTDTTFTALVEILPPPVAAFAYSPEQPSNFEPVVTFTDQSIRAVHWDWFLNGKLVSQAPTFSHPMPDTGIHEMTLVITHPEQCQDTVSRLIDVAPKVTFFLPNAFTPNEDSVNDLFRGKGETRGISDYRMEIWDRHGSLVFATDDIEEAWDGRLGANGRPAAIGVYVCIVTFTAPRGEPFEYRGYATLMR